MKIHPPTAMRPVTAVDSHAHVFRRDLPIVPGSRHAPEFDASLAEYLGLLDDHAISHAVLVQPSFLGTDNSFMLAALRACPMRLRGVAVVDSSATDEELSELAACGVCGIRLNLIGAAQPDLRDNAWRALLERARRLNWHVEVHVALAALPKVGQAIVDSGCPLVVDHFGRPGASDDAGLHWLLQSARSGRVWVKLSAGYRNWPPGSPMAATAATQLLAHFGGERLVWGSDWPHTQHRDLASFAGSLDALARWVPDDAARHAILVDTPYQLFRFSSGDNDE